MKKILVSIIAIVLVAAVIGTCFALYTHNADPINVNIGASTTTVNLQIFDGTNTAAQETITLNGFSPENAASITKTVDVVLKISRPDLADGGHGLFGATLTGDLAPYLTMTVNKLSAVGGSLDEDITASVGSGYDIAYTATPVAVRLTFVLTATSNDPESASYFGLAAEKTASLTLSWTNVDFVYNASTYYVVGTINGVTSWTPSASSIAMGAGNDANYAIATNVALKNGDSIKVVQNYFSTPNWPTTQEGNKSVTGVSIAYDNDNIAIVADGNYDIYVNKSNQVWVAVHVDPAP